MTRYTPETYAAISAVCRNPATKIVSLFPSVNLQDIIDWIRLWCELLSSYKDVIGAQEFLITLDPNLADRGKTLLDAATIVDFLDKNYNVFAVDTGLKLRAVDNLRDICATQLSEFSERNECIAVHVYNGTETTVYTMGRIVAQINADYPTALPVTPKRFAIQGRQYRRALIQFYKERIRFSQFSDHWSKPGDRRRRILCSETAGKKTEMIFHSNLWNWLHENLIGAAVYGSVKKVSDDLTDIEIRVHSGPNYVLEIKWLGDNGSTVFSESRICEGITQIRNYLDRDPEIAQICLVVFDGRLLKKWKELEYEEMEDDQWKEIRKCKTEEFPCRGYGLVFYLENEDASKRKR